MDKKKKERLNCILMELLNDIFSNEDELTALVYLSSSKSLVTAAEQRLKQIRNEKD